MGILRGSSDSAWRNAFAATAAISFIPNVILFIIPTSILTKGVNQKIHFQHILLCFAAGALLGDVVLHTIPHIMGDEHGHEEHSSMKGKGHDHHDHDEHSHFQNVYVGTLIILGFLLFFIAEKIASNNLQPHSHTHCNSDSEKSLVEITEPCTEETKDVIVSERSDNNNINSNINSNKELSKRRIKSLNDEIPPTKTFSNLASSSNDRTNEVENIKNIKINENSMFQSIFYIPSFSKLSPSGWLNLVADSMHNFTDGIALGASFSSSGKNGKNGHLGMAALSSIMFHEIPHELGDFSILIENGFSKWEAIKAQFVTAIAAFLGTFIGLYAQKNEFLETIMLAMTAGGFLYIATVGILPAVINRKSSLIQIFLEGFGFCLGVGFMIIVAMLEESHE